VPIPPDVTANSGSDTFEPDDNFSQSKVIDINLKISQYHNFHYSGDLDHVKFYGLSGIDYTIQVFDAESNCDAVIDIYRSNGDLVRHYDPIGTHKGENKTVQFSCPADDVYFLKISEAFSDYGENTGYSLRLYQFVGPLMGGVYGKVINGSESGHTISDAIIIIGGIASAISHLNGTYVTTIPAGTYPIKATASGYKHYSSTVSVLEGPFSEFNIILERNKIFERNKIISPLLYLLFDE
jgi:hypothetical protein